MALIIQLKNDVMTAQNEPADDALGAQETAEVILFPGVRYERWKDEHQDPKADCLGGATNGDPRTRTSTMKRDWLEI